MRKIYHVFFLLISFGVNSFAQTGQIDIDRVNQMPDLPSPYEMRDWKDVARKYDEFVYSLDKTGQYLPLVSFRPNSVNYPGLQPIRLQTYVGGPTTAAEAINIIPSIVGASLVGLDKMNQDGVDWVTKTKDFFNKANGQNVYLNNYSAVSGGDWWYDVMPNVFFYQLYTLYPPDADTQHQFTAIADRWLGAIYQMGGSSTPWTVPNMNYRGWYLATGTGNSESVKEPESAGSIAWLLYNAWLKTGDKKYLDGAQMSMEFLSNLNSNPSYELQLPYGTLIAARMNAEQGTNYNIDKMINWSFDRGDLRGWGTIVGKWDGKDVSGLIGEANDGGTDYAFAMNGYQQAAAFVPLMKYDKRYAKAISKWVLNLANASRLYYSQYLASDRQDDYEWSNANDPESVIGYEAIKEKNNFAGDLPLYGTGDAKRNGWASTNLGLYGSSHVGYLGAIVETTDVTGILKLDVNITDFYGQNAYPTYAFYNPGSSTQQITLSLGGNSFDIYDAITEQVVSSNVTGDIMFSIPANEVRLLSYLPAGSTTEEVDGKLMIGDGVVDYHYGYDFEPDFRIKSIAAEEKNVAFGAETTVYATVDNAPSAVSYEWYVNDELVTTSANGIFNWSAPSVEGDYTIVLKAKSDALEATDSVSLTVWEVVPTPSAITAITQPRKFIYENEQVDFIAHVTGANEEQLSYEWNATEGSFTTNDSLFTWTAPEEGIYTINLTVTNHFQLQSTYSLDVLVKPEMDGTTDVTAWYPFDGDVKDYGTHGFNAQSSGVKLTADARGSANSAYKFSTGDDIIKVPNQLSLNFASAVTLATWVNAVSVPEESFLISHGSWEERYKLSIIPNGKLRWTAKTSGGTVDLDSSEPLALNQFHHVAVVFSGYSMELYMDGELDTFTKHSGSLLQTTKPITFGRKDDEETQYSLNGVLDEVRIYNVAITPDEIATLKGIWHTGIVTGLENELSINPYPNPAHHGVFSINSKINSVKLFDVVGRDVQFSAVDHGDRTEIRTEFRGVLLVKIITADGTSVHKLLVD